eukprot:COSAG06_NODE_3150_length_5768_cov_7.694733_9_plen_194_part_00
MSSTSLWRAAGSSPRSTTGALHHAPRHQCRSADGGVVHVVGAAVRPSQVVVHGALEAVGKHGQAQLWWQDATSRPRWQLSPPDFLAGREHVDELRREQSRHDELHATPSHARYRARWQRAGSRHRAIASCTELRPAPPHRRPHQRQGRCPRAIGWLIGVSVAQRPRRCRSRWLTEPLRQRSLRYRRPLPTPGY